MLKRNRRDYLFLRRPYVPERIKLVIVAESPPASGLYIYDPTGSVNEPLFSALMRQLCLSPSEKNVGLRELQRIGWLLVDATYEPVNALNPKNRDDVINRDYPLLQDDLSRLLYGRPVPLVLIKANVCRLLEPKLINSGFNVLNGGRAIYFPSTGRQERRPKPRFVESSDPTLKETCTFRGRMGLRNQNRRLRTQIHIESGAYLPNRQITTISPMAVPPAP